ncbi:MAG: TolC family protein [Acidobacteriota bacterium]
MLLGRITDPVLAEILREVLERNPELASLEARTRSLEQRPAQARSLPDPQAAVTAYLVTPESRVGPQRAMATLSQKFPWFGKLGLRERAARYEASSAWARLEATRLARFTQAHVLYYEIGFLDVFAQLTQEDRDTLGHFEELARARYASGVGLQQDVVKIQAEITRDETKLLDIAKRRAYAVAALNALRNRPEWMDIAELRLPSLPGVVLDSAELRRKAEAGRPEVDAADAEIDRAETLVKLARKQFDPDITVGLSYTFVDSRDDRAARLSPPEDDGQDILGVSFGLNLPIRRARLSAGVQEALEGRTAAEAHRRQVLSDINRSLDNLIARIPLIWNQLRLFDDVLIRQSEESLRSAVSAYAVGALNALDLLDAERVLLEARAATERTRADYAIALARLEGAVAAPLPQPAKEGDPGHDR